MSKSKNILFQLSGSIAAYKACEVISSLVKDGHNVQCVVTSSATKFIGDATLEGLTGRKVLSDTFEPGHAMDHINLERWADLIVLCPATANTINKMAAGIGDDLITTLFLAHDFSKPYFIAPAMNTWMYEHPATKKSMETLKNWGIQFIDPEEGDLACGESGKGRLASPENILKSLNNLNETQKAKSILITYGGTEEPIDGVRHLSNFSGGQTGALITDQLAERGHRVVALAGKRAFTSKKHSELHRFQSFYDLNSLLQKKLSEESFDVIIHLAAVSDFSVESIESNGEKIEKAGEGKIKTSNSLSIHLKPNFKIVERLKQYSKNPNLKVIAFKLTNTASDTERINAVKKISSSSNIDFVVHNELSEIDENNHRHKIYRKMNEVHEGKTKMDLTNALSAIAEERL